MKIEFDNEEGPGDVFQMLVDNMEGLEVEAAPVDGPEFEALLVGGREDGDSDWDEIQVRRVTDTQVPLGLELPLSEPEYLRVRALRLRS